MKLKDGVDIRGLHLLMRPVLRAAELIWKNNGQQEGVTVTSAVDGVHSADSWHYYGLALDFRTRYFSEIRKDVVIKQLRSALPDYDVVAHNTHIHVEPSNDLADRHGLMS